MSEPGDEWIMAGRNGERGPRRAWWPAVGLAACVLGAAPACANAQEASFTAEAEYADPGARALHGAAVDYHLRRAQRLTAYEGSVRQRIGVRLRTPLKDRTLYHAESAHDVVWRRDGPVTLLARGIRQTSPAGLEDEVDFGLVDEFWDPTRDRLLLGDREPAEEDEDDGDFTIEHPLEPSGAAAYRFGSGDTLVVALPDGSEVRVVELRVTPRLRHATRLVGSLWVEPRSGALVRAAYRLSETLDAVRDIDDLREEDEAGEFRWIPGLLKPWTFDATVITVDYTLWEGDIWLPRRWRAEGVVRAGILEAPGEFDRAFRFTWIGTEGPEGAEEPPPTHVEHVPEGYALEPGERRRHGQEVRLLAPDDPASLRESPDLPPPVWEDAPGFVSSSEVDELVTRLDQAATAPSASMPRWVRWGPQRPDLLRYNRVEEISVGVRGAILPQVAGRALSLEATLRMGTGDLHPNARMDATRVSLRRSVTLSGYHELAATDERGRHLGPGNSAMALLAGRDDGDYYRRTGGSLAITPPPQRRPAWGVELSSERHEAVAPETRASLVRLWEDGAWAFRPNVIAEEGWEHAVTLRLAPSAGTDPLGVQAGFDWSGTAAWGPLGHYRTALIGRVAVPLGTDYRVGLRAWGGAATDDVPAQRAFAVGGTSSLRGYAPRSLVGACGAGGTLELQRVLAATALVAFADVAWAGACDALTADATLRSAGLGVSLLDGLIRADLSRGLASGRRFRFDLYLDGPF